MFDYIRRLFRVNSPSEIRIIPVYSNTGKVPFCMRCFGISAVPVDESTNFCHNCGSEGTCISIPKKDAEYLRENIISVIKRMD